MDPLDGTTNFAHGFPQFAVSIALEHGEDVVLGVVHDPLREETFLATRGGGARLNGARIGVSDVASLGRSLVASGFPYDVRERVDFSTRAGGRRSGAQGGRPGLRRARPLLRACGRSSLWSGSSCLGVAAAA